MQETGSDWVKDLASEKANEVSLSEITLPEVTASIAAKARAPQGISAQVRDHVWSVFLNDCKTQYRLTAATRHIINRAVEITQRRKIRGCDAIQLATALTLNQALREGDLPALVFVACDKDLLQAAGAEGLEIVNPEERPET